MIFNDDGYHNESQGLQCQGFRSRDKALVKAEGTLEIKLGIMEVPGICSCILDLAQSYRNQTIPTK